MAKVPRALTKQIENIEFIIGALSGLVDGTKIKLEHYDAKFLEKLKEIRGNGLELRDSLEVFKNELEDSLGSYDSNSRFATEEEPDTKQLDPRRVIGSYLTKVPHYE